MGEAKTGDTVRVHYTGKLTDGTVFDSSHNRDEPIEFTLGEGQVIPGFESAVVGMEPGDEKSVDIPVDDGYGPRRDELLLSVPPDEFPEGMDPQAGQSLQIQQPDGSTVPVVVAQVKDEQIILDANHPLAGQDLVFDIELVEIG